MSDVELTESAILDALSNVNIEKLSIKPRFAHVAVPVWDIKAWFESTPKESRVIVWLINRGVMAAHG